MAEKMSYSSPLSSWRGEKIKRKLKSFRFDPAQIYSHKNETILIHAGNLDLLEEIVDYEMGRQEVIDRGVLVVRLSDEIRPVLSDESVISFLIKSGDHEKCEQKMRPTEYVYENVSCIEGKQFPTGILCQPVLIKSVSTGDSVKKIDKDMKKALGKDNDAAEEDDESYEDSNQDPSDSLIARIPCLGYDGGISDEMQGVLRNGKFVLRKHNDKMHKDKCPCSVLDGEKCTISKLAASPEGNFCLLHWAYHGHCRLLSFRNLQGGLADRLNHLELQQFEKILAKLVEGTYSYEYMIYEALIELEVPHSSKRYDMASHKNPIDNCLVGDARGGITYPWTYVGFAGSIFPAHVEDIVYLNSVNLMVYGSPKIWIIVGPTYAEKFHQMVYDILNSWTLISMRNFFICTLLHKMTFVHPVLLDIWGIPYTVVVQKPGDLLYTCAGAFHFGCNLGVNINVAKNCIQFDLKMRLLKELYDPAKDKFMCQSNCSQSFCRDLDNGVIGRFLLSFYKLLFKGEREAEKTKELFSFLTSFYSSGGGEGACSALKMAFVGEQLNMKRKQIVDARKLSEKSILKKIQRLQCSVIREVSASFTFSFFDFATDSTEPTIFPSRGVTLTPKQENIILDGVPYNHIVIQHVEYGTSKEMSISTFEKIKPKDMSNEDSEDKTKSIELKRTIQSYSLLNKYWSNVEEGKDYEKVKYKDPKKDHDGFLLDLEVICKRLANEKKKATEDAKRKRDELSTDAEESETSSDESDESDDNGEEEEEDCTDFALLEKRKLKGTAGFTIIESSGRLKVIDVGGTQYFVCALCYNFDKEIIDASKTLVKEKRNLSEIEAFLKKKLEGKNGVAVKAFNMRGHIKKWCETIQCKHKNCIQTFRTKHSLALHIRGSHQSHMIYCPLCNLAFDYPIKLRDHWCDPETACVKIRFFEKKKSLEVVGFQCSNCSKVMNKTEQWDRHLEESIECRQKLLVEDLPE